MDGKTYNMRDGQTPHLIVGWVSSYHATRTRPKIGCTWRWASSSRVSLSALFLLSFQGQKIFLER